MNDTKMDKKTSDTLLRALYDMKEHSLQMQVKREKQIWKGISSLCNLIDVLSLLKKDELDTIRKRLDLRGISSLNKGELALELERRIPVHFERILFTLDQERYDLIHKISKNGRYVISTNEFSFSKVRSLMEWGIIFPGVDQDQKFLTMPIELSTLFTKVDGFELKRIIRRNTEWIRLTQGMLYYYGVMETALILERIRELTNQEINTLEYLNVIYSASDYYGQAKVSYSGSSLEDQRVSDAKKIMEEHRMRSSVEYYPFTKQQLLKAGEPGYIDRSPAMESFLRFLLKSYDLTKQETEEIAMQLINMVNMDAPPTMVMQYLNSQLEFPSFEVAQQITAQVMEVYNHTRMWVLKGYSPTELFQEEKKHLQPLPQTKVSVSESDSATTTTKIGRNEPCICGSGKKYKKCCGK